MGFFDRFKKKAEPEEKPLTFSDNWDFYLCKKEDLNYFIRFDIAILELSESERAKYPHLIELRVPFERDDMERLNAVEDNFRLGSYNAKFIGALTDDSEGHRYRHFAFCYSGTRDDADAIVETLMSKSANTDFYFEVYLDDNWKYCDNILVPNQKERNWMIDNHLCRNIEQQGEAFTKARPIDFYMYFETEKHIQSISDKLSEQGFVEAYRGKDDAEEYLLHLTLSAIPTFNYMNNITESIVDMLEDTDGYFDGWGCPVLKDGEDTP